MFNRINHPAAARRTPPTCILTGQAKNRRVFKEADSAADGAKGEYLQTRSARGQREMMEVTREGKKVRSSRSLRRYGGLLPDVSAHEEDVASSGRQSSSVNSLPRRNEY